jgi:hypothetical protein
MHELNTPNTLIIMPKIASRERLEPLPRFIEELEFEVEVEVPPEDEVLVKESTV